MAARQGLAGSFWPSEEQNLLLQAVLLAGEPGEQAWRSLKPHFDVQRFESGSLGLLSLLNERRGRNEPFLARLTGVRRFIWYGNHTGFEALRAALEPLRRRGLPALVLRDAALIERYYRRLGVRPLVEPAVLVRPENAARRDGGTCRGRLACGRPGGPISALRARTTRRRSRVLSLLAARPRAGVRRRVPGRQFLGGCSGRRGPVPRHVGAVLRPTSCSPPASSEQGRAPAPTSSGSSMR